MPRITRRLTLDEVAQLLGWDKGCSPRTMRDRCRERLRRIERDTGHPLIRRGGGKGNPSWVAWSDLRAVGLVDDLADAVDVLATERAELIARVARAERRLAWAVARLSELVAWREACGDVTPRRRRRRRPDTRRRTRALALAAIQATIAPLPEAPEKVA